MPIANSQLLSKDILEFARRKQLESPLELMTYRPNQTRSKNLKLSFVKWGKNNCTNCFAT